MTKGTVNYNIENLNFLVIDDNRHMLTLVRKILHALGSKKVTETEDAAEAFKIMKSITPDIIICDWNMTPLDGLEFTRMVRTGADSPNPYVPIIMLTGHSEVKMVMEARDAGVNEYLVKPISIKALYDRISTIISRPRPFIRTGSFFGPDRRRRDMAIKGNERRNEIPVATSV